MEHQFGTVKNGLKWSPIKEKNCSLATINLSLTAFWTFKKLFHDGCLLCHFLTKAHNQTMFCQIDINRFAASLSSILSVAQKYKGKTEQPVRLKYHPLELWCHEGNEKMHSQHFISQPAFSEPVLNANMSNMKGATSNI